MKPVFLIGFMGAGKTTIGQALCARLNKPVYDTDQMIERKYGKSISQIFELYGEQEFRKMETALLKEITEKSGIITTGGGIILTNENREWMKKTGDVIFLQCDFSSLWERLEGDHTRPLVYHRKKDEVESLYKKRLPLYLESATIMIDTTDKTVEETVDEIIRRLNG
ncbi:shikimate kinase [Bacillus smithii]|uniref:shikimate kinase n=1 Tax=Bacillus smithii TaxID=1479 RepID=UPI003D230AE7